MPGSVLIDTNIFVAYFRGESSIGARLDLEPEVFLSSVVLGELVYGARYSVRVDDNLERTYQLAVQYPVLACDVQTAFRFGELKAQLRFAGRMIPENDIWIAATAIENRLTLVTRDVHFTSVPDLATALW